jgi:hypothetical protein
MKPTITPCPSPNGSNDERLFLFHAPRGTAPAVALDQALRRRADDKRRGHDTDLGERSHDEERRDFELRRKLLGFLTECLDDEELASARDLLDQHLPPKRYGDQDEHDRHEADDEEERDEHPDHEKLHAYALRHGLGSDAEEELADLVMPHPGIERLGGRVHEREREADDRRRHARDRHRRAQDREAQAQDSFDRFYPHARRIVVM